MSALDLDALERLLAEAEPSAPWRETKYGIITDDGTGTCVVSWDYAWGDAEGVAECTLKPLIVAAVNALPALITSLRAAEARIERVGAILSDEGCDCYCDCDSHHNADCDLCLACRIDREVSP